MACKRSAVRSRLPPPKWEKHAFGRVFFRLKLSQTVSNYHINQLIVLQRQKTLSQAVSWCIILNHAYLGTKSGYKAPQIMLFGYKKL